VAGFIYIMSNPSMPNMLKIGQSSKDPNEQRLSELDNTSVPLPFALEYYAFIDEYKKVELQTHRELDIYRVRGGVSSREFFKDINVYQAISTIQKICKEKGYSIRFEETKLDLEKVKKEQLLELQEKSSKENIQYNNQSAKMINENLYSHLEVLLGRADNVFHSFNSFMLRQFNKSVYLESREYLKSLFSDIINDNNKKYYLHILNGNSPGSREASDMRKKAIINSMEIIFWMYIGKLNRHPRSDGTGWQFGDGKTENISITCFFDKYIYVGSILNHAMQNGTIVYTNGSGKSVLDGKTRPFYANQLQLFTTFEHLEAKQGSNLNFVLEDVVRNI
jgi:hypothetical protein